MFSRLLSSLSSANPCLLHYKYEYITCSVQIIAVCTKHKFTYDVHVWPSSCVPTVGQYIITNVLYNEFHKKKIVSQKFCESLSHYLLTVCKSYCKFMSLWNFRYTLTFRVAEGNKSNCIITIELNLCPL